MVRVSGESGERGVAAVSWARDGRAAASFGGVEAEAWRLRVSAVVAGRGGMFGLDSMRGAGRVTLRALPIAFKSRPGKDAELTRANAVSSPSRCYTDDLRTAAER